MHLQAFEFGAPALAALKRVRRQASTLCQVDSHLARRRRNSVTASGDAPGLDAATTAKIL